MTEIQAVVYRVRPVHFLGCRYTGSDLAKAVPEVAPMNCVFQPLAELVITQLLLRRLSFYVTSLFLPHIALALLGVVLDSELGFLATDFVSLKSWQGSVVIVTIITATLLLMVLRTPGTDSSERFWSRTTACGRYLSMVGCTTVGMHASGLGICDQIVYRCSKL